ncbi:hypothetical protein I4U23_028287 [Adineta vaga]|nr:hypothetical protein I4U23_028287 [Adineta vaga]
MTEEISDLTPMLSPDNEDRYLLPKVAPQRRKYKNVITMLVLFLINLLNYMDRFAIAGVLELVQDYFHVGDSEAGLLQTVFVCSYMALAPLFGYLGDRFSRKLMIILGVSLWSMTTVAGSFVPPHLFWLFVLLRSLVGVGEASYSCVAPTIIADIFASDMRTTMLAVFNIAVPLGGGLGYIVGSYVAKAFNNDWRWALRITPGLGVLCVILLVLLVEEPARGSADGAQIQKRSSWIFDVKQVLKIKSFLLTTLGFTWVSFALGSLSWWGPIFLQKAHRLATGTEDKKDKSNVALYFGMITCGAGILGVLLGSEIARRYRKINRRGDPIVCGLAVIIAIPFLFCVLLFAKDHQILTWIFIFIAETLMCSNWALISDMLMYIVIPTRRATASSIQIFIMHLFGDASSPYIVGQISEFFKHGADDKLIEYIALRNALMLTPFVATFGGAAFLCAAIFIVQDRRRAEQTIESMKIYFSDKKTVVMSSLKRSPLASIENLATPISAEEIELRELNEPLLPANEEASPPPPLLTPPSVEEVDETTPFSLDIEEGIDQSHVEFRPEIEDETNLRRRHSDRRRSSSSINRSNRRRNRDIRRIAQEFWADLFPQNNPRAHRLPILILVIFLIVIILLILCVALGYTSVDYDEFGVTRNLMTGVMNLKEPYSAGVYLILPWQNMVIFDKTARYLNFKDLTIFTTDQASIILDATIVYRIRPDQIEPIWLNFADKHEEVLRLVASNILRNHGNQYSIYDYRARREHVDCLSRILQQTLSGDCCPICCDSQTCSKTIEYSCSNLTHCTNSTETCTHGYFVDIDAVYIFKVALPQQIIKRLYTLMLKPIYTEIAESQEKAAIVLIETERQRNELLNKARQVLMNALANSELIQEKARIHFERKLLKEMSSSEQNLFNRLNIQMMVDKLSATFLLEMNHLVNLTQVVDHDSLYVEYDDNLKPQQTNDLFDFVPASNVFDLTEFLSILEN